MGTLSALATTEKGWMRLAIGLFDINDKMGSTYYTPLPPQHLDSLPPPHISLQTHLRPAILDYGPPERPARRRRVHRRAVIMTDVT